MESLRGRNRRRSRSLARSSPGFPSDGVVVEKGGRLFSLSLPPSLSRSLSLCVLLRVFKDSEPLSPVWRTTRPAEDVSSPSRPAGRRTARGQRRRWRGGEKTSSSKRCVTRRDPYSPLTRGGRPPFSCRLCVPPLIMCESKKELSVAQTSPHSSSSSSSSFFSSSSSSSSSSASAPLSADTSSLAGGQCLSSPQVKEPTRGERIEERRRDAGSEVERYIGCRRRRRRVRSFIPRGGGGGGGGGGGRSGAECCPRRISLRLCSPLWCNDREADGKTAAIAGEGER